jgi:glycosyltransferase involved in cell wall biosynthesis
MKKLSVITVNFNNYAGLLKTFESVKEQSWDDFEYVVIDGGSNDGSKELIVQNSQVDYWVSEKDSGVYNAMNKAIKAASGKYVIFMNSGDIFHNENVLKNVQENLNDDIAVLYGNSVYVNDNGYYHEEFPPSQLTFSHFYNNGLNHQATFIKRDLFFKYFLYNENYKICSDWEFFIYILCMKSESYLHLNYFICYYDFTSIENESNLKTYYSEREIILEKHFPLFVEDYNPIVVFAK